ncbi:hypothetical protein MKY91_20515 [Alkalicoccobacillus gibsonii]|uniref:MFS transporter n=1 Tax=Alkalicoccobacillus gibsonii TaxID=79881 RepID=A0ABU9VNR7_9BACI
MLAFSFLIYILMLIGSAVALYFAIQKGNCSKKDKRQMFLIYAILIVFSTLLFFQTFFNSGVLETLRQMLINVYGVSMGSLIFMAYIFTNLTVIIVGFAIRKALNTVVGTAFIALIFFMPQLVSTGFFTNIITELDL